MNELEHFVHVVRNQLKARISSNTFGSARWTLNNLLIMAKKMNIEKPCQELFDAFTIRQGPITRIYRYKCWIVKLVDAQSETHALKDSETFYNDLLLPDEETVSAKFKSMEFPAGNIDLRHLIVKAEIELQQYRLSESTLGQYKHVWRALLCFCFQKQRLVYDKNLLIKYEDTVKDKFANKKICLWRHKICNTAIRVLIEVAETGHYNWKHPTPLRYCTLDEIEPIRNEYYQSQRDKNLAIQTLKSHDKVFRHMMICLTPSSRKELRALSVADIEKVMGHFSVVYSKRSMSTIVPIFRNILDFLHHRGYIERPLSGMVMDVHFRKDNVAIYISKDDEGRLIAGLENTSRRTKAIILIAYRLGLRGCDICNLKFQDIDWKQDKIRINQKKTGRPLVVPLLTDVGNALFDYILHERPENSTDYPYVFIRSIAPYTRLHSIYRYCAMVLHDLNIEPINGHSWGAHVYRYSLVHRLLEAKVPHQVITDTLGHASRNSDKPYISMEEDFLRDCALDLSIIGKKKW